MSERERQTDRQRDRQTDRKAETEKKKPQRHRGRDTERFVFVRSYN